MSCHLYAHIAARVGPSGSMAGPVATDGLTDVGKMCALWKVSTANEAALSECANR